MTKIVPPTKTSESLGDLRPSVIRVVVGYPWTKDDSGKVISARADKRWRSIREYVISVRKWMETSVSRRMPAPVTFDFDVVRLRGTHGRMLLDNLRIKILEADILIMDIGSMNGKDFNTNVLLETGMAIACEAEALQDLFILKPAGLNAPSDLTGFLFTEYQVTQDGSIKINDVPGFLAALRGAVIRKAR
jgi:hypothetical protein